MNLMEAMEQAREAHEGQTDKCGKPYIEHPMRVAHAVRILGEDAIVVALLHDVIEDTDYALVGLTDPQNAALDAITRRDGEVYRDYIDRCGENPLARRVKMADLDDNLSPERQDGLPEGERLSMRERYIGAMRTLLALDETPGGVGWPE